MKISIIVAHNQQGIIGINGRIPWHIPEDLKHFKQLTMGKPIIMGRKTFESIGSKPLPGRLNVVISSMYGGGVFQESFEVVWASSLTAAIDWLGLVEEAFIIGGERLYAEAIPLAGTLYRTVVKSVNNIGDGTGPLNVAYFPAHSVYFADWELTYVELSEHCRFETWERACSGL